MKNINLLSTFLICTLAITQSIGQQVIGSYPAMNGGFEGATIDNTTFTSAQAGKWVKNNNTQTIGAETTVVRSGSTALNVTNGATGRRVWTPLVTVSSTTSNVTLQWYRRVSSTTNTQESQSAIGDGTTVDAQSSNYAVPSAANTWEKVTYTRASFTFTNLAGAVITRQLGTGGTMYIDDVVMYNGAVDNTPPVATNTVTISNPTTNSLDVFWAPAPGGVDGGGYVVVRYVTSPNADNDPNQNGIYAVGNTITNGTGSLTGTIRYVGSTLSFTDNVGLSPNTQYWYKVYTVDKAFNYSSETTVTGTTLNVSSPDINVLGNGVSIVDGDVTPSAADHTLFPATIIGQTSTRTFTIENNGTGTINLTGSPIVAISGSSAFAVTTQPSSTTITSGSPVTFVVTFTPTNTTAQTATISITNDDPDAGEQTYTFDVSGTGSYSATSDVEMDAGFSYNTDILYKDYQGNPISNTGHSVGMLRFRVRDGAALTDADNATTTLSAITFSAVANIGSIRSAAIFNGNTLVNASPVINVGAGTINFSGLSISAPDDGNSAYYTLRVSFNNTPSTITDNAQLSFTITSANVSAASGGSSFASFSSQTSSITGNRNRIEVEATKLLFVQNTSNVNINAAMSPSPSVEAADDNNVRDLDYAAVVSITSTGTLNSSPINISATAGLATFTSIIHTAIATGRQLTAASGSLAPVNSNNFNILFASSNTDYFRSKQTGNWTLASTWESSPDNATWNNATIAPTQTANTVTIQTGHTVTINSNITNDQVVVFGTLEYAGSTNNNWTINDETGDDLVVENGGRILLTATNQSLFYVNGAPSVLIKTGGMVEAQHIGAGEADGWANDEWTYDGFGLYEDLIQWQDGATFYWNVNGIFSSSGLRYFFNRPAITDKPLFKISGSASNHGGTNPTIIYAVTEIVSGKVLVWANSGTKTHVFGITGAGNLTQNSNSGQIVIQGAAGATAVLGGSGTITLSNTTLGLKISSGCITNLTDNKTINTGPITVDGTLNFGDKAISGTYSSFTLSASATARTKNANGLRNVSGSLQNNAATYNFSNTGATVEYDGTSVQNITNTHNYFHLNITGAGDKNLVGNTTVLGDLTITDIGDGLGRIKAATHTLNVDGDWLTDGVNAFDRGTSMVVLGGTNKTIDGATNFYTLQINGSRTVANIAGNQVNVYNALTLNSSTFTATTNGKVALKSDASRTAYLDNFSFGGTYNGELTVERYVSNTFDGYRNISAPVSATVAELADDVSIFGQDGVNCWYSYTPYPNVQVYDEAANNNLSTPSGNYYTGWISRTGTANVMNAAQGFAVRTYTGMPYTIDFTGTPNNATVNRNITLTATATPSEDGWNFTGNPYPSPISWNGLKSFNPGEVAAAYYVFNTTGEYTGNWGSFNGVTGTLGATDNIGIGQGFFVKATGNHSLNFDNGIRVANATTPFFKTGSLDNEIRLELTGNGNIDEVVTYTDAAATLSYDEEHDALKIPAGSTVYMSYKLSGKEYAINVIDEVVETTELPLVLWAKDTGLYTLSTTELNLNGLVAQLKDALTNTLTELSTTGTGIQIALNGGEAVEGRYSIVFKKEEVVEPVGISNTNASQNIRIYSYQSKAIIERATEQPATIIITNLIGQTIKEVTTTSKRTEIELGTGNEWYAIVKMKEANQTKTGKVLIK
ncbi:MAG: choice-of-anchor D domain-containing protein [Chitinophagales bacterium]|nr:choice-of-anchor D domain-containing protein [Chitinophagales bacterium]